LIEKNSAQKLAIKDIYDRLYGHICDYDDTPLDFVLLEEKTLKKNYGWIFFFNTKRFIETGDRMLALAGNGPLIVLHSGELISLGAAIPSLDAILKFEKERDL